MKTLLTTILIALTLSVAAQEHGYLACTTGSTEIVCKKVQKIETVQEIFEFHYPGYCIDIEKEMKHSNYFEIITENRGIYIEKKRLKRKKNGKIKYRRIKK